jgi:hypothetical protein
VKTQLTFGAGAVLAASLLAAATPASATLTKFAVISSTNTNGDLSFSYSSKTKNNVTTYTSTLAQINSPGDNYAAVTFAYDSTALVGLGNFAGALTFTATSTDTSSLVDGQYVNQDLMAGSFQIIYEGPTEKFHDLTLTQGVTVLLAGTFDGGEITGFNKSAQGSFDLDNTSTFGDAGTLTFTSDLESFTPTPTENSIALTASSLLKGYSFKYQSGKPIAAFKGSFDGNFSSDPGPTTSVPEPASWALMIVGVGFAGAVQRRKTVIAKA